MYAPCALSNHPSERCVKAPPHDWSSCPCVVRPPPARLGRGYGRSLASGARRPPHLRPASTGATTWRPARAIRAFVVLPYRERDAPTILTIAQRSRRGETEQRRAAGLTPQGRRRGYTPTAAASRLRAARTRHRLGASGRAGVCAAARVTPPARSSDATRLLRAASRPRSNSCSRASMR